jgi:hypothetical protein
LVDRGALVHTGDIEGDYYEVMPLVTRHEIERALGFAEVMGVLPRELLAAHCRGVPVAADASRPEAAQAAATSEELRHLRQIRDEYMRLKHSRLARMMRSLGFFDLVRRVAPRSRKWLGDGPRR